MTGTSDSQEVVLARIETKLDSSLHMVGDHEGRIRALESNRWPLPTLAALVSVGAVVISLFR